ncbi:MAG: isoprenylcysteine carboxylmethyltransferase family protein [Coriobacteriales bacterium]|nr:isoprenylcysteine carboxylmethyltransferase family protein [Actinomycetes bacterium]
MPVAYIIAVGAYVLLDRIAFAMSGAPVGRQRREWTWWAVTVPYYVCLVGPAVEIAAGIATPSIHGVIVGGLCVTAAAVLRFAGVRALGPSFSAGVETHKDHMLVTTGIYSTIRHPLYLGLALLFIGSPMIAGAHLSWIATAAGLAGIVIRTHAEEKWLAIHLPGYAEYMRHTKRFIPHVC